MVSIYYVITFAICLEIINNMSLFGSHNMPIVDKHLTSYYMLTDEGRKAVDKFIDYQLTIEKDDKRA